MSKRGTTIYDIAREVGLSHTTVSQALRDASCVKLETRLRVHSVAEQLGYRRNLSASMLRLGRSKQIAMIVPAQFCGFPSMDLYHWFRREFARYGYDMVLFPRLQIKSGHEIFEQALEHGYDGVVTMIYTFSQIQGCLKRYRERQCPIAIIGTPLDAVPTPGVLFFDCNDLSALGSALQQLLELGHRRVLHAIDERFTSSLHNRFIRDFFREHGEADWNPELLLEPGTPLNRAAGYKVAERILQERPDATAIQCPNDDFALGLIRGFKDLGIEVPRDFSVMGSENTELCEYSVPRISSISLGEVQTVPRVAAGVLEHIQRNDWEKLENHFELPTAFIMRESTGPVRKEPFLRRK